MKIKWLCLLAALIILPVKSYADDGLRTMFQNNSAIICGINIRTFNAKDTNNNGIIDDLEESGNFINAVERLDEIKSHNINTLHVLPVTPVGKMKALGTAGSLYSISDFESINLQLADKKSLLSPNEQLKFFVDECHKRGIKVIIDLPSCGSYDLFLKRPELFIKDDKQLSVVPTDWTDVRLLNTGDNDKLNEDLLELHKRFVDMVLAAGADGIRADVATIKPYKFWEEIIKYTREKSPDFLYLAEASDSWREPPSEYAQFTPYDKLLEAGFDGYYGSFFNLKDWKTPSELYEHIKFNKKLLSSYPEKKSVIMSFTTHDELSPVLIHGEDFSVMICWLEATLPFNPYFIDGFESGDKYIYDWANSKAVKTETDDDYYFVHRGKLDIFNFSRRPGGNSDVIKENYKQALNFRLEHENTVKNGDFDILKTDNDKVFAYTLTGDKETIIVLGNLNKSDSYKKVKIKLPKIKKKQTFETVKGSKITKIKKRHFYTDLNAGEVKVLLMKDFSI